MLRRAGADAEFRDRESTLVMFPTLGRDQDGPAAVWRATANAIAGTWLVSPGPVAAPCLRPAMPLSSNAVMADPRIERDVVPTPTAALPSLTRRKQQRDAGPTRRLRLVPSGLPLRPRRARLASPERECPLHPVVPGPTGDRVVGRLGGAGAPEALLLSGAGEVLQRECGGVVVAWLECDRAAGEVGDAGAEGHERVVVFGAAVDAVRRR
jgi:hypothetical protein